MEITAAIGGMTVDEAKERLSWDEFLKWTGYVEKRGSLHLGMRLEAGFALIATTISRALGGNADIKDFMPHLEEPEATPEDAMKILAGAIKRDGK